VALDRRLGIAIAALTDAIGFIVLIGLGVSLRISNVFALALGVALDWLLRLRPMGSAHGRRYDWRLYLQVLAVVLMALFLRGGVLALLTQHWGAPSSVSIVFAVAAGLAVLLPGFSYIHAGAGAGTDPGARWRTFALGLTSYAFVLRLLYAGTVELMPEETYYWNYSRHLDFGYLDHPPMVAWLIRTGTAVFGQTEFGVRAGALACGALTSVFVYRLTRNVFGASSALSALLLAQALPFFFLAGFLTTPDAVLTTLWAATLYFLERALIAGQSKAWWFVGISLGLGMISKYSIAMLAPVTLIFMLWDPNSRRWWRRWEPYGAALLAVAIFSPVLIWNAQHDWASFAFQTSRRLAEAPRFTLHRLIASMLVLLTPTGVLALAAFLARGKPGGAASEAGGARWWRLMTLAILLPLTVFAGFSLRHEVKLDWTGAPMTAALPLLGYSVVALKSGLGAFARRIQAAWTPTIVLMLLIYGAGLHYLVLGLPGLGFGKHIELVPVGWRDLSAHIVETSAKYRQESGNEPLIVGMDRYAIASELAFYGGARLPSGLETANSHLFGGMGLMYGQWVPPQSQEHRNLLLVAFDPRELEGADVAAHVAGFGPIEDDVISRDGKVVRHYYHRLAYDYRSIMPP
jgi:dolichol-phosphate mannosyltransferase